MENTISLYDLYVIVSYGYHGEPGADGYAYVSKEEAQASVDEINKKYPNLRYKVMSVQDYIYINRSYQDHRCEIC